MQLEIMGGEGGGERQTEHETALETETQHWGETDRQMGAERPTHTQQVKERERERQAEADQERMERRVRNKKWGERETKRQKREIKKQRAGLPWGLVVKNLSCSARDAGSTPEC